MSKLDINQFLSDTKPSGSNAEHLNLKEKGKAIVFLHPQSGIYKRNVHWVPVYGEVEENNKKVNRTYQTMVVCSGTDVCHICKLRKALRDNQSIDNDEIILRVGKGKEEKEFNKGEIIGAQGYGWQKNLAYKTEYLFGVVDKDKAEEVQPFVAPKSLGKKITKVIEDQIEEEGEVKGNPFVTPYAFKLEYDKDADQPSNAYHAAWNKAEVTSEIEELLEGPGVDNKPLTEKTPLAKVAWLVREPLVYDADELELDLSEADNFDPKELQRGSNKETSEGEKESGGNKQKPASADKAAKQVKQKQPKQVKQPQKKEEETEGCPSCGEQIAKSAKECKHCGAEFEEVDVINCPECDKEIPSDSETCEHCGSDVLPF